MKAMNPTAVMRETSTRRLASAPGDGIVDELVGGEAGKWIGKSKIEKTWKRKEH
jgi:hypothetical protein